MKINNLLFAGFFILIASCTQTQIQPSKAEEMTPAPPVAKIIPKDVTVHNDKRIDNYFWLRERENPEVIKYLEAENAYTSAMMEHTTDLQEELYQEMKGRIKESDLSVPVKMGDYYYYTKTEEGKQYNIHCRKKGSLHAEEEIILNENVLAEGKDYFSVGVFEVSPNHRLLAFAVDDNGSEYFTLQFKDLTTGTILEDKVENVYYSLEWGNDNKTVFYTTMDDAHRPDKIWRHNLGEEKSDVLVFSEPDESFFVDVSKSKSQKYIFINLGSNNTSEVHYLDADTPRESFQLFEKRQTGIEYTVFHHKEIFYILTNEDAINFKLVKTPVKSPDKSHWETVFGHRPETKLDGLDVFKDYLVIYEKTNGLDRLRIQSLLSGMEHYVTFDEEAYALYGNTNPDYDSQVVRFTYASMITPKSVYDYHMDTRVRTLQKQDEILGDYDKDNYVTYRLWAPAEDGKMVPMSVVHRKGIEKDGSNPVYLYGYGSYGHAMEAYFSSARISLLDRGFIYVLAHPRGGGYLGRPWYEDGKLLNKRNTFTDFIACAEYLVKEGYTNPELLATSGGSAGGLLMGGILNMRPDLFKVAVAQVPFVDVINTMLDESIPLTVTEFDEWGNPKEPEYYDYMISYSPYDNVIAQDYNHILITAGLNDPRVQYWEPAKWTAKLRAVKTDQNVLLLKTNMGAGHGGASGRYDYLKEIAFNYAFILDKLGIVN